MHICFDPDLKNLIDDQDRKYDDQWSFQVFCYLNEKEVTNTADYFFYIVLIKVYCLSFASILKVA